MHASFQESDVIERLLIIVPKSEEKNTRALLEKLAVSEWEEFIRLVAGSAQRIPGQTARQEAERFLVIAEEFQAYQLIVTKEVFCDKKVPRESRRNSVQERRDRSSSQEYIKGRTGRKRPPLAQELRGSTKTLGLTEVRCR